MGESWILAADFKSEVTPAEPVATLVLALASGEVVTQCYRSIVVG